MIRLRYMVLLSFILIVFSAENIPAQDTSIVKYLPLKVGNRWTYFHTNGWPPSNYRFLSEVISDTVFNSHIFYFLTNSKFITGNIEDGWIRIDSVSGNVYYFNPGNPDQCIRTGTALWDSLKSQLHDTSILCIQYSYPERRCSSLGNITIFGLSSEFKYFEGFSAGPISRKYVRDFGISHSVFGELHSDIYYLLGCVINGNVYGDTSLTGINNISSEIPESFSLYQNYPNPFNPSTKIRFAIPLLRGVPEGRGVLLKIYDILGREAVAHVNEQLSPGTYEVEWDGTNYPSGVYYYTLISNSFTETKRMVLLK